MKPENEIVSQIRSSRFEEPIKTRASRFSLTSFNFQPLDGADLRDLIAQFPFPITSVNFFGRFIAGGCDDPRKAIRYLRLCTPFFVRLRSLLEGHDTTLVYAFTKETREARSAAHARAFDVVGSVEIPGAGGAPSSSSASGDNSPRTMPSRRRGTAASMLSRPRSAWATILRSSGR